MYFVTTKSLTATIKGKLPMTAAEAIGFIERAAGTPLTVEVTDEQGRVVTEAQLRKEVSG